MQFVWLLVRGYASRKAAPGDHAVGAADGELEVGPLMAMPLVRGRGTVLGTHRHRTVSGGVPGAVQRSVGGDGGHDAPVPGGRPPAALAAGLRALTGWPVHRPPDGCASYARRAACFPHVDLAAADEAGRQPGGRFGMRPLAPMPLGGFGLDDDIAFPDDALRGTSGGRQSAAPPCLGIGNFEHSLDSMSDFNVFQRVLD